MGGSRSASLSPSGGGGGNKGEGAALEVGAVRDRASRASGMCALDVGRKRSRPGSASRALEQNVRGFKACRD